MPNTKDRDARRHARSLAPGFRGVLGVLLVVAACVPAPPPNGDPAPQAVKPQAAPAKPPPPPMVPDVQPVRAKRHMIAAANPLAAEAGREILRAGGSAVDAAIAAQMVLGLVEPQSSGIGGGGFLVHYATKSGEVATYDGRETAPEAAHAAMFLNEDGKPKTFYGAAIGGLAVGAPGLLRMLEAAHREHGRLAWADLFRPAIRLAETGFAISPRLYAKIKRDTFLRQFPASAAYFYDDAGKAKAAGSILVNRPLAAALRLVAKGGADAFYKGPIAADIARVVGTAWRNPGTLTRQDLASYKAKKREAVCLFYRVWLVCGMGPPSSGGITTLQILGILQNFDLGAMRPGAAATQHLIAEASRLAFADRDTYIADPDFIPVPAAGMLDPGYLALRAREIDTAKSLGTAEPGMPGVRSRLAPQPGAATHAASTTHLSVIDSDGNAVALTSSIENTFGSRLMVRGFLLNNQLTDFAFTPDRDGAPAANRAEASKRPRSSMAPTLVLDGQGRVVMAVGSPGGSRIIGYVAKALIAALDWKLNIQQAISLPNIVNRNGPTVLEENTPAAALAPALRALGHTVKVGTLNSGLHGITVSGDGLAGGADPRREGVALGD